MYKRVFVVAPFFPSASVLTSNRFYCNFYVHMFVLLQMNVYMCAYVCIYIYALLSACFCSFSFDVFFTCCLLYAVPLCTLSQEVPPTVF